MAASDANKINFFPTIDEILNPVPITKCDQCGHQFMNSSACRFHQLKQHSKVESSDSNEKRIVKRTTEDPRIIMAFHCPDPSCSLSKKWFDGFRYLRQHYYRAHAEKKFTCEMCGYKTALEKDINYHRKVRCSVVKKRKLKADKSKDESKSEDKRLSAKTLLIEHKSILDGNPEDDIQPSTSTATCTATVLQPIFFVVNPDNVHSVVDTVQKLLNNTGMDLGIGGVSAEASTQVQMPYVDEELPIYNTAATSTSFATQYDQEPVTFCERGTMMNGQDPLSYFSPPYGAEFGDMTPQQKTQSFDYSVPSTSQPQTRSFGTMFENVTTCNTGTSMINESYVSEFLRDIETQTPSYMIQDATSTTPSTSTDDWTPSWTRNN